jgi:uncharacterized protein (TIGR02246 family)
MLGSRYVVGALTPVVAAAAPVDPERAIDAAMAQSAAGWNAGDVDRFMSVYSERADASFVLKDSLMRGRPAMIARYRQHYDFADAAKRGQLSFEKLDFRPLGVTHALYVARYRLSYPDKAADTGVTTLVSAREKGGWRIIADHSS